MTERDEAGRAGEPLRGRTPEETRTAPLSCGVAPHAEAEPSRPPDALPSDELLSILAHELRNTLAPIRVVAEVLRVPNTSQTERASAYTMLDRQVWQLTRLLDDLVDALSATSGTPKITLARVSIEDVLLAAVETTAPIIESRGHRLDVVTQRDPIYVEGDKARLVQVLVNLLINSAKYTERPGLIRLTAQREACDVLISVSDNGVGIPAEMLERVFEMYVRGDTTTQRAGLGIGLALAKRFVEMHGGSICASSEGHRQGSVFVVRLPAILEP